MAMGINGIAAVWLSAVGITLKMEWYTFSEFNGGKFS